jgi:hypothetical protein
LEIEILVKFPDIYPEEGTLVQELLNLSRFMGYAAQQSFCDKKASALNFHNLRIKETEVNVATCHIKRAIPCPAFSPSYSTTKIFSR